MNRFRRFAPAVLFIVAAAIALPVRAASEADIAAGRDLVKRYSDAVIGVELVVIMKLKMGDREQPPREQRMEVNGTVISSSGLTVTSLAQVDPQTMISGMRGVELVGTDFKEVKLRKADGKEVPARFVLKDADLDLAFMAPDIAADAPKPEFPSYLKLDDAVEGGLLNTYFFVTRAPKILQRIPVVRAVDVLGIVEKPRRFYLMTDSAVGAPMLDAKGHLLGITLQNFSSGRPTGPVVMPAADIAEVAKQATTLQMQPKPPEADKPPTVDIPPAPPAPAAK